MASSEKRCKLGLHHQVSLNYGYVVHVNKRLKTVSYIFVNDR